MPGSPKCEDHHFTQGADRYGRTLATLSVNDSDAGDHLVSMGLAKVWW